MMNISMASFVDETMKLSQAPAVGLGSKLLQFARQKALPFARAHGGKGLLLGTGGLAVLGGQRVLQNMSMAEQMRALQAERGG